MTKPLTGHMMDALDTLNRQSTPCQNFNPGVARALVDRGLADRIWGSAIRQKARPNEQIQYLKITPDGIAALFRTFAPHKGRHPRSNCRRID